MAGTKVFTSAGLLQSESKNPYSYVTIQQKSGTTSNIFVSKAPVTGITIKQHVDYSLSKTMAGNFNLITFQDTAVEINIQGLTAVSSFVCTGSGKTSGNIKSIADFYKQNKASARKSGRITIVLSQGGTYQGVVISLTQRSSNIPGCVEYDLTLFGVRK